MRIFAEPGALKKLRRTPWRMQVTFNVELARLASFVQAVVPPETESAVLTIDAVVMNTGKWQSFCLTQNAPPLSAPGTSIEVQGPNSARELLRGAMSEWMDFWFVPRPRPFVLFADHDEYVTFFANHTAGLNGVFTRLENEGFQLVPDFERAR